VKDFVTQLNALVANENARPGDELLDLVLALPAKGALPLNPPGHRSKYIYAGSAE
jgi:hypothetical protein